MTQAEIQEHSRLLVGMAESKRDLASTPRINEPGLVIAASAPPALNSSPAIASDRAVLDTSARPGSRTSSRKMACEY